MTAVDELTATRVRTERVGDTAWADLARRIDGRVLRPSDSAFASFANPTIARYDRCLPEGVALPTTEADIAATLDWAQRHEIPVVARSGGHSYAGYSTTDGLLIHLGMLTASRIDTRAGTATVQAGIRNQAVLDVLTPTGLILPFGRCPTIGIAGYTLGGGLGLHTRRIGMACDALLSTRVVTAAGEITSCDEDTNADLFWACRGGAGGNFGINTSFEFQLQPASDVTAYRVAFGGQKAEEVLLAVQDLITEPALLRKFEAQFGVKTTGTSAAQAAKNIAVYAEGWYYGPQHELETILTRVTSVAPPTEKYLAQLDGLRAQRRFSDELASDPFTTASIVARTPMRAEDAADIVEYVRNWPGSTSRSGASAAFFAMGGADRDPAPDATAFVHRDAVFILAATSRWTMTDGSDAARPAAAWTSGFRRKFSAVLGSGSFVNFADPDLPHWWDAYYGSNYARLAKIKGVCDPASLLRYPQAVSPWPQLQPGPDQRP
jgi:hypothetical protein